MVAKVALLWGPLKVSLVAAGVLYIVRVLVTTPTRISTNGPSLIAGTSSSRPGSSRPGLVTRRLPSSVRLGALCLTCSAKHLLTSVNAFSTASVPGSGRERNTTDSNGILGRPLAGPQAPTLHALRKGLLQHSLA
jgi:hypothetical protein